MADKKLIHPYILGLMVWAPVLVSLAVIILLTKRFSASYPEWKYIIAAAGLAVFLSIFKVIDVLRRRYHARNK